MKKFTPPSVRHPASRLRVTANTVGESRTHQSHKANAEITNIIRRFDNTGLLPDGRSPGSYVDCSQLQGTQTDQLILAQRRKVAELEQQRVSIEKEKAARQEAIALAEKKELAELRAKAKSAPDSAKD